MDPFWLVLIVPATGLIGFIFGVYIALSSGPRIR